MPDDELLTNLREIDRPFSDALAKLGTSGEGLELTATRDQSGHVEAAAQGSKDLGKGWSVAGGVAYAQKTWAAMGKVIWRPKS